MADKICRLRSLFGADSDIGYPTHKWYTSAMILCVADAAVKLDTGVVCQAEKVFVEQASHAAEKLPFLSFRGTPRAEESLFSHV